LCSTKKTRKEVPSWTFKKKSTAWTSFVAKQKVRTKTEAHNQKERTFTMAVVSDPAVNYRESAVAGGRKRVGFGRKAKELVHPRLDNHPPSYPRDRKADSCNFWASDSFAQLSAPISSLSLVLFESWFASLSPRGSRLCAVFTFPSHSRPSTTTVKRNFS